MRTAISIRGRLVTLVVGAVVPLTVVGLFALWSLWAAKREQLDAALEQQAELAGVVFDRWLDAERQPLVTIAAYGPNRLRDPAALDEDLAAAAAPRSHWVDVRVLDAAGVTLAAHPAKAEPELPAELGGRLVRTARERGTAAETEWTGAEGRFLLAVAVRAGDGAVVARLDGAAVGEQFRRLSLPDRALVTLVDPTSRVVFRSERESAAVGVEIADAAMRSALESGPTSVASSSSIDGIERVYGVSRVGSTGYGVTVGVPSDVLYGPARRQLTTYGFVSLVVLLATVGAALLVARSIVAPLRALGATAARYGEGDFSARAPTKGMKTIALLAASFNAMADRLEAREARMAEIDRIKSDFVSSVSHELRTPLTTIKALTRLLGRESLTAEKRREYVDTIAAECDRQIDLVLNLLDLSRIEGGVFRTRLGRADVAEIVRASAKGASRGIEMRGHELVVEVDADLPAACADAKALGRVLGNVVENAIKYTPDGGRIVVAARAEGDWIEVSVTDNGRGIPPDDVPRLFDKFHRGRAFAAAAPQSGNPDEVDVSGVGLGLYLARNVMEQMGGRIGVETALGRGSRFTLYVQVWDAGRCGAAVEEEQRDAGATVGS
jgi:signal transduction histidine kinase